MKELIKIIYHYVLDIILEGFLLIIRLISIPKKHLYFEFLNKMYFKIINHTTNVPQLDKSDNNFNISFYTPNEITYYNAKTFYYSEPETLEWINSFDHNDHFIDIGANVGNFSIYYLKKFEDGFAYLFEPSFLNLRILFKNLNLNKVNNYTIFPNPLFDKSASGNFKLSYESEGSAFSSFQINTGFDGKQLEKVSDYNTFGFTIDEIFLNTIDIKNKSFHVKIDVDGAEAEVLDGGQKFLSSIYVKTVLIELF